jgi:tRNA pseudouridine38-40 synthase
MPRRLVDLEYDGTDFRGWQIQPEQRTVQGELKRVLQRIFQEEIQLVGAGRTDAGVHALGQVATFSSTTARPLGPVRRGLNAMLPRDIRVLDVRSAPAGFSARHDAISRSYRFQMLRAPSALWRRFYYELAHEVDVEAMAAAATLFTGSHDFTAFVASDSGDHCDCTVAWSTVVADSSELRFEITANRFLHNMVRRLAGVLVEVGRGRLATEEVRDILRSRDRTRGGPCLPPNGLFLVGVRYPRNEAPLVDAAGSSP